MNIGQKVRELRIAKNLTQEELADRCELSKGFISQLEHDNASPSIATLEDILQCLGSSLEAFFAKTSQEQIVFSEEEFFEKVDEKEGNTIEWIIPNAQKNQMEPIRLTLQPGGRVYPDNPHEGEEFGYVLKGRVLIHLGHAVYEAKKGEAFYFRPDKTHYITAGRHAAQILWVSTPPSF